MPEAEAGAAESPRSSVTISVNAKGSRQWVVKVRATHDDAQAVEAARDLAMKIDGDLQATYGLPG